MSPGGRHETEPEDPDAICIVGDTFAALAEVDGVRTVSQLVADVKSGAPLPTRLIAGQGVTDYELEYLSNALAAGSRGEMTIEPLAVERVSRDVAHKHRETNVLLADLERIDDDVDGAVAFAANLRLHTENELLQDHQTGQHLQGIIIIEAMRQMFIAVFEATHGLQMAERSLFVVWDALDVRFTSFLFPLPARLTCRIVEEDVTDPTRMAFRVSMTMTQNDHPAAVADVRFGVHDNDRIRAIEDRRAGEAVSTLLGTQP